MTRSQKALAGFFAFAGTMHFVIPRSYEAIMPPSLPRHREAVVVSGLAEIAGGAAVLVPSTRRFARWWLLALLRSPSSPPTCTWRSTRSRCSGLDLESDPALGALGAAAAAAAGDALGLARHARLRSYINVPVCG